MKFFGAAAAALIGCAAAYPSVFNSLTPKNENGGTNYAVLVAGSNGWGNYRHQSDVYHAYRILISNGFSPEQIIMMHYNDIVNNPSNPRKGEVINKPGGVNNYIDIPLEYIGADTTAKNFLAIISGNAANATGRVLKTTADDNIFINYSDHGATGLVAMPVGPYLYAKDLIDTFATMSANRQFNKMVVYIEACESGSMFEKILPTNTKIYGHTASNAVESSYACYYDSTIGAYLGDLWSVNWMENTDEVGMSETLQQQFVITRDKIDLSHAMQYGDLSFTSEPIGNYMASGKSRSHTVSTNGPNPNVGAVSSRDVNLAVLKNIAAATNAPADHAAVRAEEVSRQAYDDSMMSIVSRLGGVDQVSTLMTTRQTVNDWDCYKTAIETYESECRQFDDYGLKWTGVLNNLCNQFPLASISAAIRDTC